MLLKEVVYIFEKVKSESSLIKKINILSGFFKKLSPEDIKISFALLTGTPLYGKLNVGYSILKDVISTTREYGKGNITLDDVDLFLRKLKEIKGEGAVALRYRVLKNFFKKLNKKEKNFMFNYLLGEVRQGAKEKIIFKALLKAKGIDLKEGEKLLKKGNILELVYNIALKGKKILKEEKIRIFEPISPMLAEIEENPFKLFRTGKPLLLEFKMDGARLQIHKEKNEVKIFTRNLRDVTDKLPHLRNFFKNFKDDFILDAEAVILTEKGTLLPFQDFMKEFGKKIINTSHIKAFIFDIIYKNGEFLFEYPLRERIKILEDTIPDEIRMPYLITDKREEAKKFYEISIEKGNEGLLIKELSSPYVYGKRGKHWFKWKKFYTLDLTIIGAEWGHGRRKGFLSNLHLACLDDKREKFLELGKTFKGLKDEDLIFLTQNLPKFKTEDLGWMIKVKPFYVVEIAFDEVIESKNYNSGFSLRFARVKRFRFDKNVNEIADINEIRKIFEMERERKGVFNI